MKTICLVGKPNVGKSTLFNRIVGKKVSIIEDTPGVTRDRIYSKASYKDTSFYLIDTGGLDYSDGDFNEEIKAQVMLGIDESDVIIFVVDGKEGVTSNDLLIRDMLRKSNKRVIVAINKSDNKLTLENQYDFYTLGFDEYITISAEHNIGISNLLDTSTKDFNLEEDKVDDRLKFSVIGRPNVGKSSLVNALLNEERVIVSDVAGTTRDAIDTILTYDKNEYVLIDTAGLRKKGKIYESVEKYSLLRSMKAIDRSDVCILVINAEEGIIEHDKHIAGYAIEAGKALVLVVNKWDTVDNKDEEMKKLVSKFNDEKISKIEVPGFGTFEKDVFLKNMRPKAHIVVIKEGDYTIALDTILTEELIVEGMYRDLVRTLQVLRKDAGLKVEQRITLSLQTEGNLMQKVLEEYLEKITQDTLTEKFVKTPIENDIEKEIEINGEKVTVQIKGM